ncbi:MAG TPA: FliM/FliN family flagellar motor switch protein [Vicinamibacterales bacterium]|jgi:flagellar motor switch protein FliN/FliY
MSSLLTSSSSSNPAPDVVSPFTGLLDVVCELSVILGSGSVTVRRCLALQRHSVLRLDQSAGEDLQVMVNGVTIAKGEVVIVEDSTAMRVTEIPQATISEP